MTTKSDKPAAEHADAPKKVTEAVEPVDEFAKTCGLVMPLSAIDGCSETHWSEVREVLIEAASDAGFSAQLVSDSKSNMIIQKTIVQNLYRYPIVIVDVSAKNANVMFELGLRLSFGKPTIVVKDDATGYSFDTAPFRHIVYPRDMNYKQINAFKRELSQAIVEIIAAEREGRHETYLSTFAAIETVKLDSKIVPEGDFIVRELAAIRFDLTKLQEIGSLNLRQQLIRETDPRRFNQPLVPPARDFSPDARATISSLTTRISVPSFIFKSKVRLGQLIEELQFLQSNGEIADFEIDSKNSELIILSGRMDKLQITQILQRIFSE